MMHTFLSHLKAIDVIHETLDILLIVICVQTALFNSFHGFIDI